MATYKGFAILLIGFLLVTVHVRGDVLDDDSDEQDEDENDKVTDENQEKDPELKKDPDSKKDPNSKKDPDSNKDPDSKKDLDSKKDPDSKNPDKKDENTEHRSNDGLALSDKKISGDDKKPAASDENDEEEPPKENSNLSDISKLPSNEKFDVNNLLESTVYFTPPTDPVLEFQYKSYVLTTVDQIYHNDPKNIPLVLQFAQKGDLEHSLLTYKALTQTVTSEKNHNGDIAYKIKFVKEIDTRLILNPQAIVHQRSEGFIMKKKVLKTIKNLQIESLKKAIEKDNAMNQPDINVNIREITKYSRILSEQIMTKIVTDLFASMDHKILLKAIATQQFTTPSIQALRTFFDLLENAKNSSDLYLPFALHLQSKEKSPFFISMPAETKEQYQYMKNNLPYSIKNLAYSPTRLCFRNAESADYIYATNVTEPFLNPHNLSLYASKPIPVEGVWSIERNGDHYNILNLFFSRYLSTANNTNSVNTDRLQNPKFEILMQIFNIKDADRYDFVAKDDSVLLKNVERGEYLTLSNVFVTNIKRVLADKAEAKDTVLWTVEDCSHIVYPFRDSKLDKDYMYSGNK